MLCHVVRAARRRSVLHLLVWCRWQLVRVPHGLPGVLSRYRPQCGELQLLLAGQRGLQRERAGTTHCDGSDTDTHSEPNTDAQRDAHGDSDAHSNGNGHTGRDSDTDGHSDAYRDCDAHANDHGDSNADAHSDDHAWPDCHAAWRLWQRYGGRRRRLRSAWTRILSWWEWASAVHTDVHLRMP